MPDAAEASSHPLAIDYRWLFLLIGLAGGGGGGTLLSELKGDSVDAEEVRVIVDRALEQNNSYLLQQVQLMLANEQLRRLTPTSTND